VTQIDIGNVVITQSTVLTSVVSVSPIHFVFDISESDYLAYTAAFGSSLQVAADAGDLVVDVTLLDQTSKPRRGVVDFVDNAFDTATGTIRVRTIFENSDGMLVPGLLGSLRMPTSRPHPAVLVPDSAVMTDQANRIVLVVGEDDVVTPRTVVLGPLFRGLRVVHSGLDGSERIIVEGLLRARPGQKVTPQDTTISLTDGEG